MDVEYFDYTSSFTVELSILHYLLKLVIEILSLEYQKQDFDNASQLTSPID